MIKVKRKKNLDPALIESGFNCIDNKDYKNGLIEFNKAQKYILTKEQKSQLYYGFGLIHYKKGNYQKAIKYLNNAIKLKNETPWLYVTLAKTYRIMEEYDKSIDILNKIITINPNFILLHVQKGITYLHDHKIDNAIECFDYSINMNKGYAKSYYYKGLALKNMEDYNNALENLNKAIEIEDENLQFWNKKFDCLLFLHKFNDIHQCFDIVNKIFPKHPDFCFAKGIALQHIKEYEKSLKYFDIAINKDDSNYTVYCFKAKSLRKLKEYNLAIDTLLKLIKLIKIKLIKISDDQKNVYILLAKLYYKIKDFENSKKYCLKAYKIYSSNLYLLNIMANSFFNLSDYENAIKYYKEMLEFYDKYHNVIKDQDILIHLARLFFGLNDYDNALKFYKKVFELNKNDTYIIERYIKCLINLKKSDELLEFYDKYHNIIKDQDILTYLADFFFDSNDFNNCLKFCKEVLELDNDNSHAVETSIECLMDLDKNNELLEFYEKYNKIIKNPNLLFDMAYFFGNLEDYDNTLKICKQILENYDNTDIIELTIDCLKYLGKYDELFEFYDKYHNIIEDQNIPVNIAELFFNLNDYNNSLKFYKEALNLENDIYNDTYNDTYIVEMSMKCLIYLENYNELSEFCEEYYYIIKYSDTPFNIIDLYYNLDDFDNGLIFCKEILKLNNNDLHSVELSIYCLTIFEEYDELLEFYNEYKNNIINDPQLLLKIITSFYELDEHDTALKIYEELLKLNVNDASTINAIASCLHTFKKYDELFDFYNKYSDIINASNDVEWKYNLVSYMIEHDYSKACKILKITNISI